MNILLTGATGLLGSNLHVPLSRLGDVTGVSYTTAGEGLIKCDLRDTGAVSALLAETRPDMIVHLAALTDVDHCEKDPEAARALNVEATGKLVSWLIENAPRSRFLYASTDQVYDAPGPSPEADVQPKNVYARTKLAGEDQARRLENALVLRINFYTARSPGGRGLVDWLMGQSGREACLFEDIWFNPLHVEHLAAAICTLIRREAVGTFNVGASGEGCTKAAFLRSAAGRLGIDSSRFHDGSIKELNLPAYRPRDMRMKVDAVEQRAGLDLPTIEDGLSLLGMASECGET